MGDEDGWILVSCLERVSGFKTATGWEQMLETKKKGKIIRIQTLSARPPHLTNIGKTGV